MKITYIVPFFYNHDYLLNCLESIDQNSTGEYEIIIIDDGNTNRSYIPSLEYQNLRFILNSENRGAAYSRNRGLEEAEGDYIIFVDSDDYLIAKPEGIVQKFNNLDVPIDIFIGSVETKPLSSYFLSKVPYYTNLMDEPRLARLHYFSANIYRKSFLDKYRIAFTEGMKYGEDLIFLMKAINKAHYICVTSESFYHYRNREYSITNSLVDREFFDCRLRLNKGLIDNLNSNPIAQNIRVYSIFKTNLFTILRCNEAFGGEYAAKFIVDFQEWVKMYIKPLAFELQDYEVYWSDADLELYRLLKSNKNPIAIIEFLKDIDHIENA